MEKNMLNEVNTIREKMGLQPLNELQLLELQISKLDPENLDEGLWEKIKGMLPNTVYKKGGVALAKLKMKNTGKGVLDTIGKAFNPGNWKLETRWGLDKANAKKIQDILKKENNGVIRDLDKQIKEKAPDFPNTTDQLLFVQIVSQIGAAYDTIVAKTKLDPSDKDFMPDVQANDLITDLRAYVNRFLDYDLSAKFSVLNENEDIDANGDDWCKLEDVVEDRGFYSDLYKDDNGFRPRHMSDEDLCNYMNMTYKLDGNKIVKRDNDAPESTDEGIASSLGRAVGKFQAKRQAARNRQADIDYEKTQLAAKAADQKRAIARGDRKAFASTRMNTLESWNLPILMSLSGVGWMAYGLLQPDDVINMGDKKVLEKEILTSLDSVDVNAKPGFGWTQLINATLEQMPGHPALLTPESTGKDVANAIKFIGGGNLSEGLARTTNEAILLKTEGADYVKQIVNPNTSYFNQHLKETFAFGTKTAGDGKISGDIMGIHTTASITALIVNTAIRWKAKYVAQTAVKASASGAAMILFGKSLILGGVALALLRWKGRRSSRAQILRDLYQRLVNIPMNGENPIDPDNTGNGEGDGNGNGEGNNKQQKQGKDLVLYNKLKNYFKDLYNFRSQVNKDTYGKGGTSNAEKVYSGAGEVPSNLQVTPKDADDLLKLMESLQLVSEETLDDIGLSSNQLRLLKTNIEKLKQLMEMIKGFSSQDPKLNAMIQNANQNPVVSTKDLTIDSLLQSDAKSLKIFVSDFNKALYSVKFKNGNSIIDQLGKIQINKLQERAERVQSKGAMNKVYNDRRTFLANLPSYITTLYSIFSYLIDKMKSNPEGNKAAQADYLTGQKGGKQSPGLTSTDKTQMNKGLNAANSDSSASQYYNGIRGAGQNLEEGTVISKAEMIAMMIEEAMVAPEEGGEQNSQEVVNKNGRHYKLTKALAMVAPEFSTRIAKEYANKYPDNPKLSPVKLKNFLGTALNAIAFIPESRMERFIKMAGGDIATYNQVLGRVDEVNDVIKTGANYKLMMALSTVVPEFKNRITMVYNKQNPNDRLSAPKVAAFLQNVLMGAAMVSKTIMIGYINDSGGDSSDYTKALAGLKDLEPGDYEGGNFDVNNFKPNDVGGYDLTNQKDSFRIGLSKKAAEIISRQTDTKLDEKNMLTVMKLLIDTLNKKYLKPERQIPMTGQ